MEKVSRTSRWFVMLLAVVTAMSLAVGSLYAEDGDESSEESSINVEAELARGNQLVRRSAYARAIPHYKKVLKAAPLEKTAVYYNLAEVLRAEEKYEEALIYYQAYLNLGTKASTRKDAKKGLRKVKSQIWNKKLGTLSVDIEPESEATILLDGTPVARNGDLEDLEVAAGEYTVSAEIVDHKDASETVTVEKKGSATAELKPLKKTFYGKLDVSVDEEGAKVEVTPKKLKAPREPNEGATGTSPIDEPIELETGKWLITVTKDGFHKWVRYKKVRRGKTTRVNIDLEKKLPEEIR